ncbi:bifunctional diguanylate cyclase/phosphodiesterase [Shewanella xiamenensis]|uniref:Bifunctional diguanylate cyclase/phosphodiesterase n=1 Tax=Shewanella xiamenensis TaxID=332186 RepID=A0AAW6QSK5_9GAMM|nr:bifunctional diguanylate cyclase/phosphodiesterase [Shewanella xiamenensis]MDG5898601.1 bifunctional diguanylate cyclase/phosphodiesterase [Shewanella xiamenensis]TVL19466.1 diguanylate cyclase [Shewanella xiamenensis]TVL19591.1 diguanylate cyclase [Shewanella xiamenensis]TVL25780.1 diguanylate cyclase [Shewanella xiamenensis]TVL32580.1 diguanylate cyclase [Shewanella xiamenensis]
MVILEFISLALVIVLIAVLFLLRTRSQALRQQQQFLAQLCPQLEKQKTDRSPLNIADVPQEYASLYHSLNEMLAALPAGMGKDKLTGLNNRVGLKRALASLMPITQGTLVLIDIYRFRYVNDLFGFVFGDILLKQFAERLTGLSLKPKLIARLNGDEFFLYYEQSLSQESLLHLRGRLQVPFKIKDTPVSVRLQIGCLQLAQHHADVSNMLRRLDLALKKARSTRIEIACYSENDDIRQLRELKIIDSLPNGLQRNHLYMVYQPKQDVASGGCTQVEALIRWEHEELGLVSPGEFIPLAECAGMIDLVSHWALEQVLQQQVKWRLAGISVCVALNLSTRDLDSETLPHEIDARLKHYQLPPECLMIEITESTLMADLNKAVDTLAQIRSLGVKLAIDDFGTGHSSLAYLKHLPANEVKIDKAFLEDLKPNEPSEYILEASINIAKKLGYEVTVEGVETQEVLNFLVKMGVDRIQGICYAKPMRAVELEMHWHRLRPAPKMLCVNMGSHS